MEQAERIAAARGAERMSQEHLAKAAGVSVRTVIRAEGGHNVSPESIRALCAVLGLDASSIPGPVEEGISQEEVHAALVRSSDGPVLARDIAMVSHYVAEAVPGLRMAVRPDMVAMQRDYARKEGIAFDTTRRTYMRKVMHLWIGLYAGLSVALYAGHYGWDRFVSPLDPEVGLYCCFIELLLTVIVCVATTLVGRDISIMTGTLRTVFAIDATHVHEFRMVRLPHLPFDQAPSIERRSLALDGIASIRRTDVEGRASFFLDGPSGRMDLNWVIETEAAADLERLIGSPRGTPRRGAQAGIRAAPVAPVAA